MPISPESLVQLYPRLYHMAEVGTWESISERGLRSTTALLDLYEIAGAERFAIESAHRPEKIPINHPVYGPAVIRDQKPMRESALQECLIDMTPREWYELLNHKVFFWLTHERLLGLLSARAYRDDVHCIITVDTELLIRQHVQAVGLSPINSGSTLYKPQRRGRNTFQPPEAYPYEERKRMRGYANAIAELCVDYAVPDIRDMTVRVAHMKEKKELEVIYEV